MKTIIYNEIDGYKIVKGFGTPIIDPIETVKAVRPLLGASDEMKTIEAKRKLIIAARGKASEAFKAAAVELRAGRLAKAEVLNLDINVHIEEAKIHEDALIPLVDALEIKRRQLTSDSAIYFEPREGEILDVDGRSGELLEQVQAAGEHEVITIDGVIVDDFRGVISWLKSEVGWSESKITSLGVDPILGSIIDADLTPEQRAEISTQMEAERISKLTATARITEKALRIDSLASQAALKRSAFEIQGVAADKALADSKAWYDAQVAALDTIYG